MARALPAIVLVLLLALPSAAAQTVAQPITGSFTDVYVVSGRVLDGRNEPIPGARLLVELEQRGIRATPLSATANCFGDFITAFDLQEVLPGGKVHVTVVEQRNATEARATADLDPFYRRTELVVRAGGDATGHCPDHPETWKGRVTITGRVVNRTEPYEEDGITFESAPYRGFVDVAFVQADGTIHCPPTGVPGQCERLHTDERGDFRYSFVFGASMPADGTMVVGVAGRTHNVTIDPVTRMAVLMVDLSGRGPPDQDVPAPGLALLATALAAGALTRSVLLRRRG